MILGDPPHPDTHLFISYNLFINQIIHLSSCFLLVARHNCWLKCYYLNYSCTWRGGIIRTTVLHSRNNIQPGSLGDDELRQCSSVIHPLLMTTLTFHIIIRTTAEWQQKKKKDWWGHLSNWWSARTVVEKVLNFSHLASINLHTRSAELDRISMIVYAVMKVSKSLNNI